MRKFYYSTSHQIFFLSILILHLERSRKKHRMPQMEASSNQNDKEVIDYSDTEYVISKTPKGDDVVISDRSADEGMVCQSTTLQDDDDDEYRLIYANRPEENSHIGFSGNRVVTSRYTAYNFLPKIMFYEFSKLANAYFLFISIMQTIKPISNTGGFPASLPALVVIVSIDMFFAALEDYSRHVSDREANGRACWKLSRPASQNVGYYRAPVPGTEDSTDVSSDQPKFLQAKWDELVVGDMIRIHNREEIPADVVIIAASEPNPEHPTGICYVETKSLDGETNLKLRQGLESTYTRVRDPETLSKLKGTVICEQPNNCIHRFCGSFRLIDSDDEPIKPSTMLLRGSTLRNTDWVYAMVINTGPDTKIMMTSSENPKKWSNMERRLNIQILYICALMFFLCLTGAITSIVWNSQTLSTDPTAGAYYLYDPDDIAVTAPFGNFFVIFMYYFLLLNSFIPVSLYVSMTTVKFMQSYFMNNDIKMYHEESNTPCQVRSMSLNEELGQIDYVFSDKTGTLTCNVMDFRKCTIGGVSYGRGTTEIGMAAQRRMGIVVEEDNDEEGKASKTAVIAPFVNFDDPEMQIAMSSTVDLELTQRERINSFWEHLAISHTVMPETINAETGEIRLSASSPDEQALVAAAACFGYSFFGRSPGKAKVKIADGSIQEYRILQVLEFNSTRKRMSVIVERADGKILMLTKGADTVMYERLKTTSDKEVLDARQATLDHMEIYASEGLRTLVIASAEIERKFYEEWSPRFKSALNDLGEIELRRNGQDNLIDSCMEEIEKGLEILGATAIEDRLQNGVPSTISQLAKANIKIWMLTGDKEETAINIGFACELLNNEMDRVVISAETHCNSILIRDELRENLELLKNPNGVLKNKPSQNSDDEIQPADDFSLIIDGEALELALEECPLLLLEFARECKAVIACRVSPAQKAQLVSLVRENIPKVRTLAIGDGANDVSMIQAAHVGVGISGQEGMQAANSSDYSIAQFRFLQRLLLVHGRWNYIRMAKLILYIFYKNVVMNLTQYWYMIYNGFSGQKFFLEWGLQGYNLFYTALPVILVGIFEQDLPDYMAMRFPRLYHIGQENSRFNTKVVWTWISSCVWESLIISFGTIYGLQFVNAFGETSPMWDYGCTAFTIVVLVVSLKLALHQQYWYWIHGVVYIGSFSIWIITAAVISEALDGVALYWSGVFSRNLGSVSFWILVPLITFFSLSRDIFWKGYRRAFYPSYRHLAQEVHSFGLEKYADNLLSWPPPSEIPTSLSGETETIDVEVGGGAASGKGGGNIVKRKLKPVGKAVGRAIRTAGAAAKSAVHPFRKNHGFSFSYDAETVMAQSAMATERFSGHDIRATFERHGSRGSLAFRNEGVNTYNRADRIPHGEFAPRLPARRHSYSNAAIVASLANQIEDQRLHFKREHTLQKALLEQEIRRRGQNAAGNNTSINTANCGTTASTEVGRLARRYSRTMTLNDMPCQNNATRHSEPHVSKK